MNAFDILGQAVWRPLVFALLHSLWQGGLIGLVTAAALRGLPARRQGSRYLVSLAGQFGVLLAALLTWAALGYEPPRPVAAGVASSARAGSAPTRVVGGAAVAGHAPFSPRAATGDDAGPGWVPVVAAGWMAGVALMLVRAARSALAAVGLTRGPSLEDRDLVEGVERLRREMGIGRRVRVVSCGSCPGPAVLGLVWPTVVLPVSMMTGLTPEAVRAILAHELAHVKRFDYAVNLAQMFVESLLFFNPAVWWLGRQARMEREACCDTVAVRLAGGALVYSRVLADWAERVREASPTATPAAALAWAGGGKASPLLERVLRLLRPGEAPRPRVSWPGLLLLVLVGPVVLFGLRRGAGEAVALAAQVLSPAERVERLEEARAAFAAPAAVGEGKATLKGTIFAPDGGPLPTPIEAGSISKSGNGSYMAALMPIKGAFSVQVHSGVVWLSVQPKEFAPMMIGPFDARPGATVEGIDAVLEPGFPARVRVVDERGRPVAGARVTGGLTVDGGAIFNSDGGLVTDEDGETVVEHAARGPYRMGAKAPGFQVPEMRDVTMTPDGVVTLTLVHARAARGVVVGPDGAPVAGAKLKPFGKYKPQQSYQYGESEAVMATTGEDGRFSLDALDDDATYSMMVETERQGRRLIDGVKAGQEGLRWTVGPDLTITGTVKGDLGVLETQGGKPVVDVTQSGPSRNDYVGLRGSPVRARVPVEKTDGGGRFFMTRVLPGEVVVKAGGHAVKLNVETPENPVTIDLSKALPHPPSRRVIFRVVTPGGGGGPTGSVVVVVNGTDASRDYRRLDLPLKAGEVTFEAPSPGRVSFSPESVNGYWFKDESTEVPPGDGPLSVEVKGVPAGAIVGRVVNADGTPVVSGASLSARVVEKPAALRNDEFIQVNNARVDGDGRFFLNPLPIGGTYAAVVGRGHNVEVSRLVKLDGTKATERVDLVLADPAPVEGRVVGPDGRPVGGVPLTLALNHPLAGTSWSPPTPTGGDGRFRFNDLNPALDGYRVTLESRRDYQPVAADLKPGGPPVEIRLTRGHVVTGVVVDAKTGRPIPGVVVYATRREFSPGVRFLYESEGKTDDSGRFRFSNLGAGLFLLNDREGLRWEPSVPRTVTADQADPVEIRATLPDWSTLKPVPAAKPVGAGR